ncbi:MAG TPA: hypothetical protein VEG34_18900 [Thermoanaerobaculia bacterium]|nr:hypothetical protein [Thermoanaerobaculia bacterium]
MITKSYAKNGQSCRVTFQLNPESEARSAAVLGDFNDWRPEAHPMERAKDGSFRLTVSLPAGRSYRFRYLFDGESWANDETADSFVLNQFGSQDAILDLSAADRPAGQPAAARPSKAAAAKTPVKPSAGAARTQPKPAGAKTQAKPKGETAKTKPPAGAKTQTKPAAEAGRTKAAGQKRQPAGEAAARNAPPANEAAVQAPPRPAARRRRTPDAG